MPFPESAKGHDENCRQQKTRWVSSGFFVWENQG
jgi:hypothetical protein